MSCAVLAAAAAIAAGNWYVNGPRAVLALLVVGLVAAAYEYAASRRERERDGGDGLDDHQHPHRSGAPPGG